jgi:hypothetical protein
MYRQLSQRIASVGASESGQHDPASPVSQISGSVFDLSFTSKSNGLVDVDLYPHDVPGGTQIYIGTTQNWIWLGTPFLAPLDHLVEGTGHCRRYFPLLHPTLPKGQRVHLRALDYEGRRRDQAPVPRSSSSYSRATYGCLLGSGTTASYICHFTSNAEDSETETPSSNKSVEVSIDDPGAEPAGGINHQRA